MANTKTITAIEKFMFHDDNTHCHDCGNELPSHFPTCMAEKIAYLVENSGKWTCLQTAGYTCDSTELVLSISVPTETREEKEQLVAAIKETIKKFGYKTDWI
jgi:hypothetical protein